MTSHFKRHFLGPLIVLASLILGELGVRHFGWPVTLAIPYALLALSVFYWSGLRASLVSAAFVSIYPFLHSESYELDRATLLTISAFMVALPSGILKRALVQAAVEAERNRHAAELINAANGNLGKLREIHLDTSKLVNGWPVLEDEAKFLIVKSIQGNLAHVLTIWEGWHQLYQEREALKWDDLKQKLGSRNG